MTLLPYPGFQIIKYTSCLWPSPTTPSISKASTPKPSTLPSPSEETPSTPLSTLPHQSPKPSSRGRSSNTRTGSLHPPLSPSFPALFPPPPFSPIGVCADAQGRESWLAKQRQRNRMRIWMISLCFCVVIGILIAIFAWLGSNHWFKHEDE